MTRQILILTALLILSVLTTNGQSKPSDKLKDVGCGTVPEPDTIKIKYSGIVSCDKKPIANLKVKFCKSLDTTYTRTNDSGVFTTMILFDRHWQKRYPKIVIEDKKYAKYEFQINELHLDTIGYDYQQIELVLKKKAKK